MRLFNAFSRENVRSSSFGRWNRRLQLATHSKLFDLPAIQKFKYSTVFFRMQFSNIFSFNFAFQLCYFWIFPLLCFSSFGRWKRRISISVVIYPIFIFIPWFVSYQVLNLIWREFSIFWPHTTKVAMTAALLLLILNPNLPLSLWNLGSNYLQ